MAQRILFDGQSLKAVPMESLPPESWVTTGGAPEATGAEKLGATVATLFRAIDVRANGLAGLPWEITPVADGAEALWSSTDEDPPPQLEFIANLPQLLWQTEASWCFHSQAFWHKERNQVRVLNTRWLDPDAVSPIWDASGLTGFERRLGSGQKQTLAPDDVVYLWRQGLRETAPAAPPVQAAAQAAGVLHATDLFASQYFARGAIKATLLTVDGSPSQAEMAKLESWWKRFFSGIGSAWQTAAVRAGIVPVVVGDGLDGLSSTTLTADKQQEILIALGVPASLVMANAANFATSQQDEKNLYNLTLIPDALLIQRQVNRQLLAPMGLRLTFKPQELSAFQDDENTRAAAFKLYTDAGLPLSVAAEMLGLYLPTGVSYADLDAMKPPPPFGAPAQPFGAPAPVNLTPLAPATPAAPTAPPTDAAAIEAAQFKRWLKKRPGRDASKFEHVHLTAEEMAQIITEVAEAQGSDTPDRFRADAGSVRWEGYP